MEGPISLLVDNPTVNPPFEEPKRYWSYKEGQPVLMDGRRPAGYYLRPRTRGGQTALFEEEFVPLDTVNGIRNKVAGWREGGRYAGVSAITRHLLTHWRNPERERKLFFCQIEAIETLIWLAEAPQADKQGLNLPKDEDLIRYACKMATGSGKTVVMGMVIAWQVLNKLANPQDKRFSDAVLMLCPNLTIRERLQVLYPWQKRNYYEKFGLLPGGMLERLQQGRFYITNWHLFSPKDDSRRRGIVQRGPESNGAFCNRVLKELGAKKNILVINDEAHHAYRPAALADEVRERLTAEEAEEREEATVWVGGLDRINNERGINFCADFSATPFYIQGSGYPEGEPFPWVSSDFGLVDAIECGIVKIPCVPVDDNTGAPVPKYFRLWEHINDLLPASERATARRRAKPESVLREAEGALAMLASQWQKKAKEWAENGQPVPPAMIAVCDNTSLAKLVHEHIASGGAVKELQNRRGADVTIRIDSKLLAEAESAVEGQSKEDASELLRKTVDTVGKTEWEGEGDPPGKNVRCVVSVAMLSEGWDAQNVTQILGLRAFGSQLLCEQVMGRGLRRINYDDFSEPEYVDVYGVPFEVIPVKKKPVKQGVTEKTSTLVQALKERKALEITYPRVEGFVFDVRLRIRANLDAVPYLLVDPAKEPTWVTVMPASGYRIGRPDRLGPGKAAMHNRNPFHRQKRLQATVYEIAAELALRLKSKHDDWGSRQTLFPQVLQIVWDYVENKVASADIDTPLEEIALLRYRQEMVDRLSAVIEPDEDAGEQPMLPVIEKFRPTGKTGDVLFRTVRSAKGTTRSHVSHVVLDNERWEQSVAFRLEKLAEEGLVVSYVKNDHLDFTIPYEWQGQKHEYRPDFLVRYKHGDREVKIVLEVKGYEDEQDRQKETVAQRWVRAVNRHGEFGKWAFVLCTQPGWVRDKLAQAAAQKP